MTKATFVRNGNQSPIDIITEKPTGSPSDHWEGYYFWEEPLAVKMPDDAQDNLASLYCSLDYYGPSAELSGPTTVPEATPHEDKKG